ncbi:Sialidase precursor [Posidoniimonas corsicana]|uniref:Sialidase n=1 Tax=Posidoniimonas corsicana TaxID=1938618 RepID=A0A5C5VFN1_9BACT|nr:dockerin type I domain-containing protein [Posidoniimonas corsicana]TWT36911.1 Sialidase precursor [Posidoniimonas corsicana]
MGSITRAFYGVVAGVACVAITAPARAEQVGVYQAGATVAFDPELYGWIPADAADAGLAVLDTVGGTGAAWQIADSAVGGAAPHYLQPLSGRYLADARQLGWRMTAAARLVSPSGGLPSMGIGVYFDNAAYLLQLDLEGGALVASLWDHNNPVRILSEPLTGVADAQAYHDYELRWSPASGLASLYFDGRHITDWDGVPSVHGPGGNVYQFGASAASGSGVMNFRRVEFETLTSLSIPGDYNGDSAVDAADYAVWRDHLGGGFAAADGNRDGVVNQQDYEVWRDNFGRAAGIGIDQVPEPSALLLAPVAIWLRGRDKRATR